MRKEDKINH